MLKRVAFILILIIASFGSFCSLFNSYAGQLAYGSNAYAYVQVKCRTEGDLALSFFTVSYTVKQTIQTEYLAEFVMSGNTPFISITIQWLGNSTNAFLGNAKVTVFSSLFSMQNGSTQRIMFWDDPYYENQSPEVVVDELHQYTGTYSFNLTNTIAEAQTKFANKAGLTNANQSYLGTRIFLTTTGVDAIRETGQERHVELFFQKENQNPDAPEAFLYSVAFTIADDSEFLSTPTLNDVPMSKVLKRVDGNVGISYGDFTNYKAVAEWRVPDYPPIWLVPPWSWLLSALIGAIVVSTPVSLVAIYARQWWLRPKLRIKIPARDINEPAVHPVNGIAFYHLIVENNGKTTVTDSELHISFRNMDGTERFSLVGKWDRGPEPLGPLTSGLQTPVMPSLIPFSARVNLRPGMPDPFCLVIKDKEDPCYAFAGESYLHNFKNPLWQIPPGDCTVEVNVRSGEVNKAFRFLLRNKGDTIQDVEINEL